MFAREEPQNENSTLSILDLKGTLIMKYLTSFKTKLSTPLLKRYYWKCLHGCLHYIWYKKKNYLAFGSF